MLVGGIGSLFLQMLHPHAMAGVADHSKYQDDPLARLAQTANFISATTYGSETQARGVIDKVLFVHQYVHGVADDGQPYDSNDPHLLLWVHCAEIAMFLAGYQRFGAQRLSAIDADQYVADMTRLARDLGVIDPPTNVKELRAALLRYRPELRLSADGAIARDFIAHSVVQSRNQRMLYRLMVLSAWSLLDPWARELLGVKVNPFFDRVLVRPSMALLSRAMRFVIPPAPRYVASDRPPSTTTT
jgi:uncharacterized protein (DUF2236 family)